MAKRKSARVSISPIHPSLHFVLFLVLALVLVVVVALVMREASKATRASLVCGTPAEDPAKVIENLSIQCKYGIRLEKDANDCYVWSCRPASETPQGQ